MADIDFEALFKQIKEQLIVLVTEEASDYLDQAKTDALDFVEESKDRLAKWIKQLSDGDLDNDEFMWLVLAQKDLIKMRALTEAGLAAIRIDELRKGLVDTLVQIVTKVIPIP